MGYTSMLSKIKKSEDVEVFVKAILYGPNGTGKTTSVLASAPKPILVIDAENRVGIYSNVYDFEVFPSSDPNEILNLSEELKLLYQQGQPLPWKTILLDSGTEFYRHVKKYALDREREIQKTPNKTKLELSEWEMPKSMFYDTFDNIKNLPINFYCTAHEGSNYLQGQMMKVDPTKPTKPDLEKRAEHHFDLVAHFEKKANKYKVTFEKNCILNKQHEQVLPPVIDNVNNEDIIGTIHKMVTEQKGYEQPKAEGPSNVSRGNAKFESKLDESMTNVATLQWSNERILKEFKDATGFDSPDTLRSQPDAEQRIGKFLDVTREALSSGTPSEFEGVE